MRADALSRGGEGRVEGVRVGGGPVESADAWHKFPKVARRRREKKKRRRRRVIDLNAAA